MFLAGRIQFEKGWFDRLIAVSRPSVCSPVYFNRAGISRSRRPIDVDRGSIGQIVIMAVTDGGRIPVGAVIPVIL